MFSIMSIFLVEAIVRWLVPNFFLFLSPSLFLSLPHQPTCLFSHSLRRAGRQDRPRVAGPVPENGYIHAGPWRAPHTRATAANGHIPGASGLASVLEGFRVWEGKVSVPTVCPARVQDPRSSHQPALPQQQAWVSYLGCRTGPKFGSAMSPVPPVGFAMACCTGVQALQAEMPHRLLAV